MTSKQKLLRIAKLMGWRRIVVKTAHPFSIFKPHEVVWCDSTGRAILQGPFGEIPVPNYPSSLDAMADAEATLTNVDREQYRTLLKGNMFAPASARSSAFLRILSARKK